MGPAGQSDPPMRHGAFRIKPRRFLERPDGRAMVEAKEERHPLIEIAPRLRRIGCDQTRVRPQPLERRLLRGENAQAAYGYCDDDESAYKMAKRVHTHASLSPVVFGGKR